MSEFRSPLTGDKLTAAEAELFNDGYTSKQTGPKRAGCYICEDPDFAQMGLPLCRACPTCGGHIAADDTICDDCGRDEADYWAAKQLEENRKQSGYGRRDCSICGESPCAHDML